MAVSIPARAEIPELLDAVHRRIRADARHDLEPLGVTPGQVRALRAIARLPAPVRMSDVADALGIARRSATTVVDALAERDLIDRRAAAGDRRGVVVEISPAGSELLDRQRVLRRRATRRLLGRLPPADQDTLAALLAQLLDAI